MRGNCLRLRYETLGAYHQVGFVNLIRQFREPPGSGKALSGVPSERCSQGVSDHHREVSRNPPDRYLYSDGQFRKDLRHLQGETDTLRDRDGGCYSRHQPAMVFEGGSQIEFASRALFYAESVPSGRCTSCTCTAVHYSNLRPRAGRTVICGLPNFCN